MRLGSKLRKTRLRYKSSFKNCNVPSKHSDHCCSAEERFDYFLKHYKEFFSSKKHRSTHEEDLSDTFSYVYEKILSISRNIHLTINEFPQILNNISLTFLQILLLSKLYFSNSTELGKHLILAHRKKPIFVFSGK